MTIRSLFNNWISLLRLGRQVEHNPLTDNVRREIPLYPEAQAMNSLARSAVDILQGPSSPLEWPRWAEDFMRNPRYLELSGREGAETLDAWRAQTEEKVAALLGSRPWGLLHMLGLLRRLPTDRCFLGEREAEGDLRRFDTFQATVTERLVLKYARWEARGVELEVWQPATFGFARDKPAVDATHLAEILTLLELGAVRLAYAERMRRSVVRGQTMILRPDGVADSRPAPELRMRRRLHDERTNKFSFLGETTGTFGTSRGDAPGEGGMSAPHAPRTAWREDKGGDW